MREELMLCNHGTPEHTIKLGVSSQQREYCCPKQLRSPGSMVINTGLVVLNYPVQQISSKLNTLLLTQLHFHTIQI